VPHLPVLEDGFLFVDQESEVWGCSVSGRVAGSLTAPFKVRKYK